MDAEIKNAVNAADQDAQYDNRAKRLLGNKIILAHILVKTVDEFHGMNPLSLAFPGYGTHVSAALWFCPK